MTGLAPTPQCLSGTGEPQTGNCTTMLNRGEGSLSSTVMLNTAQDKVIFLCSRANCWYMLNLLFTRTCICACRAAFQPTGEQRVLLHGLFQSRCETWHFTLLNTVRFQPAYFSRMLRSLKVVVLPPSASTVPQFGIIHKLIKSPISFLQKQCSIFQYQLKVSHQLDSVQLNSTLQTIAKHLFHPSLPWRRLGRIFTL